jgi:hypothetical protein
MFSARKFEYFEDSKAESTISFGKDILNATMKEPSSLFPNSKYEI